MAYNRIKLENLTTRAHSIEMILITGSTGFVGRHIVRELVSRGKELKCLVRTSSDVSVLKGLNIEICYGDVTNQGSLKVALEEVEAVIHLVAIIRSAGNWLGQDQVSANFSRRCCHLCG